MNELALYRPDTDSRQPQTNAHTHSGGGFGCQGPQIMGHVCLRFSLCGIKSQQEQIRPVPGWLWKPNPQQPPLPPPVLIGLAEKLAAWSLKRHNIFYTDFGDFFCSPSPIICLKAVSHRLCHSKQQLQYVMNCS